MTSLTHLACAALAVAGNQVEASQGAQSAAVRLEQVLHIRRPRKFVEVYADTGNQRVAVVVSEERSQFVLIDGKEGPRFEQIDTLIFSHDGGRVAYVGRRGEHERQVVLDGMPGPVYRVAGRLTFSPDGKRFAYFFTGEPRQGTECPCASGMMIDTTAYPSTRGVVWDPSGSRDVLLGDIVLGDSAGASGTVIITAEGIQSLSVRTWSAVFSPDGKRLALVQLQREGATQREEAQFFAELVVKGNAYHSKVGFRVVVNDSVLNGPPVHAREDPIFSSRGDHLAYVGVLDENKMTVVLDGEVIGDADARISRLTFSPNGERLVYRAGRDLNLVVCDVSSRDCQRHRRSLCGGVAFSPNSERLAYVGCSAVVGRAWVAIDTTRHSWFDWVGRPVFGPDNRTVAYFSSKGSRNRNQVFRSARRRDGSGERERSPIQRHLWLPLVHGVRRHDIRWRARLEGRRAADRPRNCHEAMSDTGSRRRSTRYYHCVGGGTRLCREARDDVEVVCIHSLRGGEG